MVTGGLQAVPDRNALLHSVTEDLYTVFGRSISVCGCGHLLSGVLSVGGHLRLPGLSEVVTWLFCDECGNSPGRVPVDSGYSMTAAAFVASDHRNGIEEQ